MFKTLLLIIGAIIVIYFLITDKSPEQIRSTCADTYLLYVPEGDQPHAQDLYQNCLHQNGL